MIKMNKNNIKTIPVIDIIFKEDFTKENIALLLSNMERYGCSLYHLKAMEQGSDTRLAISKDVATEYLSNLLNRFPNILDIAVKYKDHFFTLSLYNASRFTNVLALQISSLEPKDNIRPWIIFLLDISQGVTISFIDTITDGSTCDWEYGQIASNKNL